MNRISRLGLALGAVLVVATVASCSSSKSTPKGTPLTDATEIITRSASSVQDVTSLHIAVAIDGSVNAGAISSLVGGPSTGLMGNISLDGTTLTGDIDIAHKAYRLSVSVPKILGMTEDVIQVDGYQYSRNNLQGDKYTKTEVTGGIIPIVSAEPSATLDVASEITKLRDSLKEMGATTTLVGTEKVAGQDAYHIRIDVPVSKINDQLKAAGQSMPALSGITIDTLNIDYWASTSDLKPAKISVAASSSQLGNLSLVATLSKYNESVDIKAPSADQIQ